jgi:hypothetical protein
VNAQKKAAARLCYASYSKHDVETFSLLGHLSSIVRPCHFLLLAVASLGDGSHMTVADLARSYCEYAGLYNFPTKSRVSITRHVEALASLGFFRGIPNKAGEVFAQRFKFVATGLCSQVFGLPLEKQDWQRQDSTDGGPGIHSIEAREAWIFARGVVLHARGLSREMPSRAEPLTHIHQRWLNFICDTYERTTSPPSYDDLRVKFSCTKGYVSQVVKVLVRCGAVKPRPSPLIPLPRAATYLGRFLPRTMGLVGRPLVPPADGIETALPDPLPAR